MEIIKIMCNGKETQLPRGHVDANDLSFIFNVKKEGMHLKVHDNRWKNIYPKNNSFEIPEICSEALLIALQKTDSTTTTTTTTGTPGPSGIRLHKRRGNAAASSSSTSIDTLCAGSRGLRAIPAPCKKKKELLFKMVTISDFDEKGSLHTIYEVPVDLSKLDARYDQFGVDQIQQEVGYQIGGSNYIITNKKGNPIRDMPNTRGKDNWNNKQVVRAVPHTSFKKWRSSIYEDIIKDYSYGEDEADEDESDESDTNKNDHEDDPFKFFFPEAATANQPVTSQLSSQPQTNQEFVPSYKLKEMLERMEGKLDSLQNTERAYTEEQLLDLRVKMKECFRCVVCLDFRLNDISVCSKCSRLLGCPDCVSSLDCCPLCRAAVEDCQECSTSSRIVIKIPGLELLARET